MKMQGVLLPGQRRVEFKEFDVPEPGHGQVLIKMKASSICGSDIRAIYREHLGHGPEGYQGVIAGHEPCGQIVKVGPGCKRFNEGDRVILYHISGCGVCNDCREGYMISCTSEYRAAYHHGNCYLYGCRCPDGVELCHRSSGGEYQRCGEHDLHDLFCV